MTTPGDGGQLSYAVRPRVVFRYTGRLCVVLSILTGMPFLVALILQQWALAWRFGVAAAGLLAIGLPSVRIRPPRHVQVNEALVVSASIFLIGSLAMAYPLAAAGLNVADALFESVSAITTTGLSTVGSIEGRPGAFLFARAWMQWYGGLGIVVLSLALVLPPGTLSRELIGGTSSGRDVVGSTILHARVILGVYLVLTMAALIVLLLLGLSPFDAVVHSLTAVSTGGFGVRDDSLATMPAIAVQAPVFLFCLAGALPFDRYYRAFRNGPRELIRDPQARAFLVVVVAVVGAMIVVARFAEGMTWADSLHHGSALAVSAQTTSGFSTIDVVSRADAVKLLLVVAMIMGGAAGSTAGGIKMLRVSIVLRLVQRLLRRTALSEHGVLAARIGGRRIESSEVEEGVCIILLYLTVIGISWTAFLVAGHPALDALLEVASATGTVGLSTGLAAPELDTVLKAVLCADMLLGRLEIVALIVLFYPRTWRGKRREV